MHVITRKRLNEFVEEYPDSQNSLAKWYKEIKRINPSSFVELRETFPAADRVGKLTVFDIGGNKIRLIAAIHYNRNRIYIRHMLTHEEYNKNKWRE